ncbi:MAG: CpaF family protein [Castellaniella sp.]
MFGRKPATPPPVAPVPAGTEPDTTAMSPVATPAIPATQKASAPETAPVTPETGTTLAPEAPLAQRRHFGAAPVQAPPVPPSGAAPDASTVTSAVEPAMEAPPSVPHTLPTPATRPARRRREQPETIVRSPHYNKARQYVFATLSTAAVMTRTREQVRGDIEMLVAELVQRDRLPISLPEQHQITSEILNDMFGVGPIEPLLQDESISDIMVNGPDQVYVERRGRLELTPLKFRDNDHLTNVVQRIAASIGRRVDESSPMVDARLADGSRVNVIMPPLALDGVMLSIRKFSRSNLSLPSLAGKGSLSLGMSRLLQIAATSRLNIIISGGTGSGKTTLLNALSQYIDAGERIVTIEDSAELQLQQPHVVRLETRPPSIEGTNAVNQGDLVRNALRMRPDRIILGETRGAEAFDVLQAMNTGHDGSMTTLHANSPRDALIRLESMVMMANANLPLYSIRRQVASAIHMIVQVERMRDGGRRVTNIVEIAGMEGDVIVTQELFRFNYSASAYGASIQGSFDSTGLRPIFSERARNFGLETQLLEACRL